jgi:hypothetical protein
VAEEAVEEASTEYAAVAIILGIVHAQQEYGAYSMT